MKLQPVSSCLVLALAASSTPTLAADTKVGGYVAYLTTIQEQSALPAGGSLLRVHQKGIIVDAGPPGPLDHNRQDCDGILVMSADGKHAPGAGYCDAIDKDGDRWAMWWKTVDDVNTWGVVWGTGKYAGMTGGGGTDELQSYPDGDLIRYEGVLHLK
jgi:hypothetical protein